MSGILGISRLWVQVITILAVVQYISTVYKEEGR